jgi:hypothetical protein
MAVTMLMVLRVDARAVEPITVSPGTTLEQDISNGLDDLRIDAQIVYSQILRWPPLWLRLCKRFEGLNPRNHVAQAWYSQDANSVLNRI